MATAFFAFIAACPPCWRELADAMMLSLKSNRGPPGDGGPAKEQSCEGWSHAQIARYLLSGHRRCVVVGRRRTRDALLAGTRQGHAPRADGLAGGPGWRFCRCSHLCGGTRRTHLARLGSAHRAGDGDVCAGADRRALAASCAYAGPWPEHFA